MNDETKAELMKRTREWLQSCVNAATRSGVPEEADLEAFILAHIDGEPARLAAALENMREACARQFPRGPEISHNDPWASRLVRATPLDATPLADELRTLRARIAELETFIVDACREKTLHGSTPSLIASASKLGIAAFEARAEKAEAQVAAARAECARVLDDDLTKLSTARAVDSVLRAMDEAAKK